MKFRSHSILFVLLIVTALAFAYGYGLMADSLGASHRIKSQNAILQLKVEEGAKSLAQLVREQESGVIEPSGGRICMISIANSFGGGPVIIAAPPGQSTEFEFKIGPGGFFNVPETDGPKATLEQIFVKTDNLTKAFFVWEFCR